MFLGHRFNIGSTELKWRFIQIDALIVLVSELVSVGGLFILRLVAGVMSAVGTATARRLPSQSELDLLAARTQ